ncbi:universal stress protein [Streptomyces sp. KMM 9044]|uniref:universal stress protein n=1 Tax=Streptomyces sp. KMM 9044 TaxID=2744474 RepID=UPI002151BA90|nr:universal stress protein [Streptomyces sp. KMM 9044]WAX81486.1 universal stress protein [Streptomyces sp. KMM 9044]
MTIPLVVGVDGAEAGLEAVDWAVAEAARHTVPLHLVHAAAPEQEASDVINAASERAGKDAPAVRLSSEVLHEDAASALVGEGHNAFALVLDSRGLGDLAELLLGAVSLAVAARAGCPVVVVRGSAEHREGRFGSVVVGVEDGEGSDTAVGFAVREAHAQRCGLVEVHAWSAPIGTPPGTSARCVVRPRAGAWYALEAHRRPPAQVLGDALRGPAEQYRGTSVSRRVVEGPARHALLAAAPGADLLVVGAGKRHGHSGLQPGLINHAVLHHAPCPVVVVPQI